MKNKLILIGIFLVIGIFAIILLSSDSGENLVAPSTGGDFQKVVISMKDFNYDPSIVKVQVNKPVRIYLDDSVYGCFRSFTIPELGLAKNLRGTGDYLEFTPIKRGEYVFACSMNMGRGKLIVE